MNLFGLLSLLHDIPGYRGLGGNWSERTLTLPDAVKPFLLASLHHTIQKPTLMITATVAEAKALHEELISWCPSGTPVCFFPKYDVLPYERLTPDIVNMLQRLWVLAVLRSEPLRAPLVVASCGALMQKTLPKGDFEVLAVSVKQKIDPLRLLAGLEQIGYEATTVVQAAGEVSRRGGIVDVFSPEYDQPARIEFFGDEVESIRWFDPGTQRSKDETGSIILTPAREMLLPPEEVVQRAFDDLDVSCCNQQMRDLILEDMERMRHRQWRAGLEFYQPLFDSGTIVDYLPEDSLVVLHDPSKIVAEMAELESQAAELRQALIERGELPKNFPLPYVPWVEMEQTLLQLGQRLSFESFGQGTDDEGFDFKSPGSYVGQIERFLDEASRIGTGDRRLIIVSRQASRLAELLAERDIHVSPVESLESVPPMGSVTLVRGALGGGWISGQTTLLTDTELFGFVKKRRPVPKRRDQHEIFLADLSVGDHVVHIDHGIARFSGIVKMTNQGAEREYLVLEYSEGDKLYVPSDQVDRVARYIGAGGSMPALSRLNTQEWSRTKQRVKKATEELAHELLAIYASREVAGGLASSPDSLWQKELEAAFPYVETPDQLAAIRDIKKDMESPRPMDRLVCGDVGYGKTEVALRAAFKAVMDNKQVAVLVPTTILAQQHYNTFKERMAAFPVEVEVLSRFRSPKEQQAIVRKLADRSVDICVGTHRLLQHDVVFGELGLVIIDEEQKFGVSHKERLKRLRSEVDVLTLSATPIPRTLHMSLIGVRDLSTMETPPQQRLPIKTYVSEYDEEIVREAFLRELDRGGQIFFLHNRVQSIAFVARQLADLVPEAKIVVGHGQMGEDELEAAMLEFQSGKADVLVCTTIIESGLDMPNANTLIINHADKLGLTQLYHLRGRVGRGDVRAYAYFLYEKGKRLTELAETRLKTIFEATELGAGFQIAMKDLEIRGAGNLLGAEQSGQMGSVGFDLYCRLLSQAVEELKSSDRGKVARPVYPAIDMPMTAFIPEDYVTDMNLRLDIYQRLAGIDSIEQVNDMFSELEDRFGMVPQVVENLLTGVIIKILGARVGVSKISTEAGQVVVTFMAGVEVDRTAIQRRFGSSITVGSKQIRMDPRKLGKFWGRVLEQVLRMMVK